MYPILKYITFLYSEWNNKCIDWQVGTVCLYCSYECSRSNLLSWDTQHKLQDMFQIKKKWAIEYHSAVHLVSCASL